eukprot:PhM_4_TR7875/c0_g1_i1/m.86781
MADELAEIERELKALQPSEGVPATATSTNAIARPGSQSAMFRSGTPPIRGVARSPSPSSSTNVQIQRSASTSTTTNPANQQQQQQQPRPALGARHHHSHRDDEGSGSSSTVTSDDDDDGTFASNLVDALNAIIMGTAAHSDIRLLRLHANDFPQPLVDAMFSADAANNASQFIAAILYEDNTTLRLHLCEVLLRFISHDSVTPAQAHAFLTHSGIAGVLRNNTVRVLATTSAIVAECCEKGGAESRQFAGTSGIKELICGFLNARAFIEDGQSFDVLACSVAYITDPTDAESKPLRRCGELAMGRLAAASGPVSPSLCRAVLRVLRVLLPTSEHWVRQLLQGAPRATLLDRVLLACTASSGVASLHADTFRVLRILVSKDSRAVVNVLQHHMSVVAPPPTSSSITAASTDAYVLCVASCVDSEEARTMFLSYAPIVDNFVHFVEENADTISQAQGLLVPTLDALHGMSLVEASRTLVARTISLRTMLAFNNVLRTEFGANRPTAPLRVSYLDLCTLQCIGISHNVKTEIVEHARGNGKQQLALPVIDVALLVPGQHISAVELPHVEGFVPLIRETHRNNCAATEVQKVWRGHCTRTKLEETRVRTSYNVARELEVMHAQHAALTDEIEEEELVARRHAWDSFLRGVHDILQRERDAENPVHQLRTEVEARVLVDRSRVLARISKQKEELHAHERHQMAALDESHNRDLAELKKDEADLALFPDDERDDARKQLDLRREQVRQFHARERHNLRDAFFRERQNAQQRWENELALFDSKHNSNDPIMMLQVEEERARGYGQVGRTWWEGHGIYQEEREAEASLRVLHRMSVMPDAEARERRALQTTLLEEHRNLITAAHRSVFTDLLALCEEHETAARLAETSVDEDHAIIVLGAEQALDHEYLVHRARVQKQQQNEMEVWEAEHRDNIEGLEVSARISLVQEAHAQYQSIQRASVMASYFDVFDDLDATQDTAWKALLAKEQSNRSDVDVVVVCRIESTTRQGIAAEAEAARLDIEVGHHEGTTAIRFERWMRDVFATEINARGLIDVEEDRVFSQLLRTHIVERNTMLLVSLETAEGLCRVQLHHDNDTSYFSLRAEERLGFCTLSHEIGATAIRRDEMFLRKRFIMQVHEFLSEHTTMGSITLETDIRELITTEEANAFHSLYSLHLFESADMRREWEREVLCRQEAAQRAACALRSATEREDVLTVMVDEGEATRRRELSLQEALARVEAEHITVYRIRVSDEQDVRARMLDEESAERVRVFVRRFCQFEEEERSDLTNREDTSYLVISGNFSRALHQMLHVEERSRVQSSEATARRRCEALEEYAWMELTTLFYEGVSVASSATLSRLLRLEQSNERSARSAIEIEWTTSYDVLCAPNSVLESVEIAYRAAITGVWQREADEIEDERMSELCILILVQGEAEEDSAREALLDEEADDRSDLMQVFSIATKRHNAARDVQRVFRGHVGRRKSSVLRLSRDEEMSHMRENVITLVLPVIQICSKAKLSVNVVVRRYQRLEQVAATLLLQRVSRGIMGRQLAANWKVDLQHRAAHRVVTFMRFVRDARRVRQLRDVRNAARRDQQRREENAAMHLQWWARGLSARRQTSCTRRRYQLEGRNNRAAVRIQCMWRSHVARAEAAALRSRRHNAMAQRIQCAYRRLRAQRCVALLRHQRDVLHATRLVQRYLHAFASRVMLRQTVRREAAKSIQCVTRGHLARAGPVARRTAQAQQRVVDRIVYHSATNIQRVFRGYLGRRRAQHRRSLNAMEKELAYRRQYETHVSFIQAVGRGCVDRSETRELYFLCTEAATKIQCLTRQFLSRGKAWEREKQKVVRQQAAVQRYGALVLQQAWRCAMARTALKQQRQVRWKRLAQEEAAAVTITRWARGTHVRRHVIPEKRVREADALLRIQLAWRAHAARERVAQMREERAQAAEQRQRLWGAVVLQRWSRRCLSRRHHAAYVIQRYLRKKKLSLALKKEEREASMRMRLFFARDITKREAMGRLEVGKAEDAAWASMSAQWRIALGLPPASAVRSRVMLAPIHRQQHHPATAANVLSPATTTVEWTMECPIEVLLPTLQEEASGRKVLHMEAVQWWAATIRLEVQERVDTLATAVTAFFRREATTRRRIEAEQLRFHRDGRVKLIVCSRHEKRGNVQSVLRSERVRRVMLEEEYRKDVLMLTREMINTHNTVDRLSDERRIAAESKPLRPVRATPAFARTTDSLRAAARALAESRALKEAQQASSPQELVLSARSLTDDAAIVAVHRALRSQPELRSIRLEGNNLTDVAVMTIAQDVAVHGNIQHLNLSHNPRLTDVSGSTLVNMVRLTPSLVELDLAGTGIALQRRRVIQNLLDQRSNVAFNPSADSLIDGTHISRSRPHSVPLISREVLSNE